MPMSVDLGRILQKLLGSARNLLRISWSTIASTHLPHKHPPRMPTRPQTARTQNGGAAVTGLWPLSMNPHVAAGTRACLRALKENCLKIAFEEV